MADWDALRSSIAGNVIVADDPEYDDARRPAIANFHDVLPAAVVRCAGPADVVETLAFANRAGLPLVPRSGGHCFAGRSTTPGVVLDVSAMRSVSVSAGVATVGAGIRLGTLYDALAEHGATIPAGCGPTVGVAGLVLGGGLGILGRTYGLTSDSLVGAEVVLPDGRVVRCDEHHEPELFWALRGSGGGRFGIVTSLDFATVPAPTMTAFHLTWPYPRAASVVAAWQDWAPDAPDEIAPSLVIRAEREAGTPPTVNVFGAMIGTESDAKETLDGLVSRVGSEPATSIAHEASHRQVKQWLTEVFPGEAGEAAEPHLYSKSAFFERSLPAETITELLASLTNGRPTGEMRILDFMPWGGAYNRVPAAATAFPHRSARFLLKPEVVTSPEREEPARRWLRSVAEAMHPHGTGGAYVNFPDPDLDDWDPAYHGPNLDRLLRAKAAYDPDGRFGGSPGSDG